MCGIAGIFRLTPPTTGAAGAMSRTPSAPAQEAIPEAWLDILDDAIQHRGPDGAGRFRDSAVRADGSVAHVALIHRRLAIIDLADGAQPMVSERGRTPDEGRVAVTFNGCVYNHRELRAELESAGRVFLSDHSDTEVLLHAWREWGAGMQPRLDAMLSAAIWDATRGTLTLCRDDFGEKPLYYVETEDRSTVIFANNFAGVLRLWCMLEGGKRDGIDETLLAHWIAMGQHDSRTPLFYARQLPPGVWVTLPVASGAGNRVGADPLNEQIGESARQFVTQRYPLRWRQSQTNPYVNAGLVNHIEEMLTAAVATRLDADVPVACLLSGGVDSSLISLLAHKLAEPVGGVTTICVRMPDERYDESEFAAHAAEIIGSKHLTIDPSPEPAADLQILIRTLGLPFGDSSLLATFWACLAAREHAKVLLSGDGGDELFLGYERYHAAKWLEIAGFIPDVFARTLDSGHPKSSLVKLSRLIRAAHGEGYPDLLAIFDRSQRRKLLARRHASLFLVDHVRPTAYNARRFDLMEHFAGDMLRKTDTASMMAGVELRAPMLQRDFSSFVLSLNPVALSPGGQRKGLLRAVARKYFPPEIIDRPKMGFAIPIGEWFRSNYGGMRDLLRGHLEGPEPFGPESLGISRYVNMKSVRQIMNEHDEAGNAAGWSLRGRDHSQRLYMLLVLSIWTKGITS